MVLELLCFYPCPSLHILTYTRFSRTHVSIAAINSPWFDGYSCGSCDSCDSCASYAPSSVSYASCAAAYATFCVASCASPVSPCLPVYHQHLLSHGWLWWRYTSVGYSG